jgi:hypothetical protein
MPAFYQILTVDKSSNAQGVKQLWAIFKNYNNSLSSMAIKRCEALINEGAVKASTP